MFFHESETIAREHPGIARVASQVDSQLAKIISPSRLRPDDFAAVLAADPNQVLAVFECLDQGGVLSSTEMVECPQCGMLAFASAVQAAVDDEDEYECTACGCRLSVDCNNLTVFQLTARSMNRTKADVEARSACEKKHGRAVTSGEPLCERAMSVLIAMLQLGAVDCDSRRTTEDIAVKAIGKCCDANSLKGVMADLKTRQLIDTKVGSGGGCWLTELGRTRANKLNEMSKAAS